MSPAAWGALATVVGPTLVFVTWLLSRREKRDTAQSDVWAAINAGALSTTETMKGLIAPLETELMAHRGELVAARREVTRLTIALEEERRDHQVTLDALENCRRRIAAWWGDGDANVDGDNNQEEPSP